VALEDSLHPRLLSMRPSASKKGRDGDREDGEENDNDDDNDDDNDNDNDNDLR